MTHSQNQKKDQSDFPLPAHCNIKARVEIVNSIINFQLSKKIKMSDKIGEIIDINWTSPQINYHINMIADILWVSGKLNADLTYTRLPDSNLHIQQIMIPWKKTCTLEYLYPPLLPYQDEKHRYLLKDPANQNQITTHYEQIIFENEKPKLEVIYTKITTNQVLHKKHLELEVDCEIAFRILQNQIINE